MKCLSRNRAEFYYALYEKREPVTDDHGNVTGEYDVVYGNPIKSYANISPARGEMQTELFGESESYDKVIVMDDTHIPIDEYSILWVDTLPKVVGGTTTTPHDYIVKKVARSLNNVSIAISKVKVSG